MYRLQFQSTPMNYLKKLTCFFFYKTIIIYYNLMHNLRWLTVQQDFLWHDVIFSLPIDLGEYTYHHSSVVKVLCLWPQITTSNPPGAFVLIIELHFWKSKLFIQNSLVFAFLTYLFLVHYAIFYYQAIICWFEKLLNKV